MASIKRKTFDDVENSPQKKKQRHSEESGETTSETADSEIPLPSEATGDTADSENPLPSEATGDTADSENPLPSEATSKTADSDVVEQENSSSRQETQSGPLVNTEKQEHNKRENAILPNETHTALDHVVYDDVKPEDAEKQEQAPTMSLPPRRKIRHRKYSFSLRIYSGYVCKIHKRHEISNNLTF